MQGNFSFNTPNHGQSGFRPRAQLSFFALSGTLEAHFTISSVQYSVVYTQI